MGHVLPTQGYQIIAIGPARYLDLAAACAASLRVFDGSRPIQLVTDRDDAALRDSGYGHLFDDFTPAPTDAPAGPIIKLHAYDCAIYDETMFVDADCLLLKRDIDTYWSRLSADYQATLPGHWRREGQWYGMDIAEMCRLARIARLVQMNSGTFYFKRGLIGKSLFDTARALFGRLGNFTRHIHGGTGAPDEPYLAMAMGMLGLDPHPMRDEQCNSWMTATMNSLEVHVDATSGRPALVKRHRTLSPSLCHFTNLFPREAYDRVARELLVMAQA
ncbi:hypothetical protein [Sphingomonas crusticola]|uniref:hypothetical protein n=1 Tax=Sphingomonas crusticola TaxID=1697973 RepID=UPI0013C34962|nr:hypothetical protein [Sphingomonas crusticola]